VTVQSQPSGPSQLCSVANGSGKIAAADVTDIVVSCVTPAIAVLAGQLGGPGNIDGPRAVARFNLPGAVTLDAAGTLYISDSGNHTVRKITPDGMVSTLAGLPGTAGFADGLGSAARFAHPKGITVDGAGDVYVADNGNNIIRKVSPQGAVTTFAGQPGVVGSHDGVGTAAQFDGPWGLATDSAGNLYVAEWGNYTVRKITPAAAVTTVAGQPGITGSADGNVSTALFYQLTALTLDTSGNIYVADYGNGAVRKIAGTTVTTLARPRSTVTTACGDAAMFCRPSGVVVNAAGVYVSEDTRSIVDLLKSPSALEVLPGTYNAPAGLALDSAGTLYVADGGNNLIRTVTPAGEFGTLAGALAVSGSTDGAANDARFNFPGHPAVDSHGNVFVPDSNNFTVREITPAGEVSTFAGCGLMTHKDGIGRAACLTPNGIVVDAEDNLYVTDGCGISKVTPSAVVTTFAGNPNGTCGWADGTGTAAQFAEPDGIAIDSAGNLYVAELFSATIRKITPAAVVTTVAGSAGVTGSADGVGSVARFNMPRGIATDAAGNIYVADAGNLTVRKISPAGSVTTLAGSPGVAGAQDGAGSGARFAGPISVAADTLANVYVTDSDNATIRLISPAGVVTTVAGTPSSRGNLIGDLPGSLSFPFGIAFDASTSRLIVTDTRENVVLVITPP
jgi:sugar lactone lactonase YvrE